MRPNWIHIDLKYLPLAIPLLLDIDFLPTWYISINIFLLAILSLFKPPKFIIYINFISVYFVFKTVGIQVIPETMVPTLNVFIMSRMLMNKANKQFEVYPLFLWIGTFAVFSATLYYLLYALGHILLLFYQAGENTSFSLKRLAKTMYKNRKQLISVALFTSLLFIFFPRFHGFLPLGNQANKGKIGYGMNINNSNAADLKLSSQTAFIAEVDQELAAKDLYWRGRVHTQTDGYNWRASDIIPSRVKEPRPSKLIQQKIKYEQDFNGDLIVLDSPLDIIESNLNYIRNKDTNEFKTYIKKKKATIVALSQLENTYEFELNKSAQKQYVQMPLFLPSELKNFLAEITKESPLQVIQQFKQKIIKDKYSYTLTPGPMPTMNSFFAQ